MDSTASDDDRWMVINGRRWRRTDPCLPAELEEALKSHLGRGRSAVKAAKSSGDADQLAAARRRVGLAKTGLGERGPYWWDEEPDARIARASSAVQELDKL
ncbi:hypothetical protein B0I08_103170 [Glaciihabitans tibetensis]|uniref:Biopolymer transporter Tol n=1 Tax=Glaciihabitans tibetensis TaxID=1266600 RepID=A0A2T0VFY6_9MICO|nr:biopolymer transporter Tol [Glaciihabitans tibetensis]PRY68964.1 hypothetical protein B0I08_103170 [Glaciihabitans tibetensis]